MRPVPANGHECAYQDVEIPVLRYQEVWVRAFNCSNVDYLLRDFTGRAPGTASF